MARTRGAKSSSPSSRKKVPRGETVQDPTSEPSRQKAISPPVKPAPQKPPARRYLTRSGVPSPVPSPAPPVEPEEPQPPLPEPQNPSEIAPEAVTRRPMLTQPPIEGNLDCRARPFHSELCFDTATFQLRPELAQSFHLL
ncbi:anther-specific proline-rich protein APG-like [Vitis vinifera]|uniref:anther-specific proline-rich protein APG-like n=1 Tax=Vitis vinifera TaxID=29760 RepID=UPI0008FEBD19|nr:anther-specific proline-rich protein APG-like [Vitis vinifera]|eukprot:XP_019073474.1 PREDICTED: anther-specific proline-rich protein APG-like [Vitis vinifera]